MRLPATDVGDRADAGDRAGIAAGGQRELRECRLRRNRAAGVAEMGQAAQRRERDRRGGVEARVDATVRGEDRQRDALLPGEGLDLLQPVAPIGAAADQPDQDALCAGQRLLDIGVDRQRMLERGQVREA